MKKVSVIIPVHNTEKYLESCLYSVLNQTEENIEVLCVNDHSVDHSLDILKYYESMYSYKMKVIDMKDKCGVSCARNVGLQEAQGEYIGFVDSDDVISLNMYHDFYHLAKMCQMNVVIGNCLRIKSDDFLCKKAFLAKDVISRERNYINIPRYLFDETPAVWDKLFSHDLIYDMNFLENHIYEDVGFTYFSLIKARESLELIRDDYLYRITPGSIMNNRNIRKEVLDIIFVCYDAFCKAKEIFSKEQLNILEDVYKIHICDKINDILRWPLDFKIRKRFIDSYLSIANYYFPAIFELHTMYANFLKEGYIHYMKNTFQIHNIENHKINFETENLKRSITKCKKNT